MKKPNILLLFTGGTIAQVKDPKTKSLMPSRIPKDILALAPELKGHFEIGYEFISNLDSSNVLPKHWVQIANAIYKNYDSYDGFVVSHGTDTMSYTASAVSFALQNLGKPVVFTGSQLPPGELGSDAKNNLINAFRLASMNIGEIVIIFGEKILRGNRSSKISESAFNAFWSPIFSDLGRVRLEIELFNHHKKRDSRLKPVLKADFCEDIFVQKLVPGVSPAHLKMVIEKGVAGIVIEGFGAGNLPNEENSYVPVLKEATKRNIPVIIDSQCVAGISNIFIYNTGLTAQETGAISSKDMTFEATVTKLMWILAQTKEISKVKSMMDENLAGETL